MTDLQQTRRSRYWWIWFGLASIAILAGSIGLWLYWRWQTKKVVQAIPGISHPYVERVWMATVGVAFLAVVVDIILGPTLLTDANWWSTLIEIARPLLFLYVFGFPGILAYWWFAG